MAMNHKLCLQCDDGTQLRHGAQDMRFDYKGKSLLVVAVSGWHCPVCAECVFDRAEGQRYSNAVDAFATRIDAEEAEEIRAARKALGLNQAEAGRIFGGGISAFSEYERGKTQAHKSTVLLLRLLAKHPELLSELRQ
jgi:HTH-type transcriptional regulator/antitoxin MqsA